MACWLNSISCSSLLLLCTLIATFEYPLSETFSRNEGVNVTVTVEQCEQTLKTTETFSALGETLGQPRISRYHLEPPDTDTPYDATPERFR